MPGSRAPGTWGGTKRRADGAQTRPGAKGALLFHSCMPTSEYGDAWPQGVPVQVHGMDGDQMFVEEGDLEAARALVAALLICYDRVRVAIARKRSGPSS